MADTELPSVPRLPSRFAEAWSGGIDFLRGVFGSPNAFGLPENFVRALIAFLLIGGQLFMQWKSPQEGAVPAALVSAAGLATGFYLTGGASPTMKGLLSLVYALAFVGFLVVHNWVPEAINSQVTIVIGIYYGAKVLRDVAPPTPTV